jgi:Ca-activated chloride channel family protein
MWRFLMAGLLACTLALPAHAEGRSIIVLDASGSMWGQIDGRPKLDIAREALAEVLGSIPADTELGLMAYGHREKGSCDDIELIVPPAAGTAQAISDAAAAMQFLGKTPLTESVRRAAAELRSTEEEATVILITDGIETCEADPCALGRELEASGVDFTAHVVGFGLTEEEGKQVACLAQETGGQYLTAGDLASLTLALQTTVIAAPAPEPEPEPVPEPAPAPAALEVNFAPVALLAAGVAKPDDPSNVAWEIYAIAADGSLGDRVTTEYDDAKTFIEPGTYRLRASLDTVQVEQDITLTADALTAPEVIFNAARVTLHPKGSDGGDVIDDAALNFTTASGIDTTYYGPSRVYLPAGDVTLTAQIGAAKAVETLTLTAGQILERDVVVGVGLAVVDAYYVEDMVLENTQHLVEILEAKKALDGSRTSVMTSYGPAQAFDLPAGDYIARVSQGAAEAEVPFTVKVGEHIDVPVILTAGVLAVTATGATEISIYDAKKDINGNLTQRGFDYAETINLTAPAGDYIVEIKRDGVLSQSPATVKAGERTEITVP